MRRRKWLTKMWVFSTLSRQGPWQEFHTVGEPRVFCLATGERRSRFSETGRNITKIPCWGTLPEPAGHTSTSVRREGAPAVVRPHLTCCGSNKAALLESSSFLLEAVNRAVNFVRLQNERFADQGEAGNVEVKRIGPCPNLFWSLAAVLFFFFLSSDLISSLISPL